MAAKKRLRSTIRKYVQAVTELAQSQVLPHRPVPSVMVKVRSCIHSSLSLVRFRMYRPVRSVTVQVKSLRKNARTAMVPDTRLFARNLKFLSWQVLTMASVSVWLAAVSRERGDLLVEAVVSQHPIFKRQDTSIYSTVPISFAKAALGGPIRIKTVDGEVEYEVKPGTQTDTKVRLKGKGVPSLRNRNVRGDHYVTLVVKVPERMNQAQKDALKRYDDLMNGIEPEGEKPKKKGLFK